MLWVVWGFVHVAAGVLTLAAEPAAKFSGIADAVDPATLTLQYPSAVAAIANQHAFNLLWFGAVTLIAGIFIWRGSRNALWLAALVGGLADIGYFVFLDLGGFVKFVPGTLMTIVSGTAIVLSAVVLSRQQER